MRRMFARRFEAVVAGAARAGYTGVVEAGTKPGVGAVAHITFRRCLWMGRMFTRGRDAVVATAATAHDSAVIDAAHALEGDGVVTVITVRHDRDVRSG